MIAPLLAACTLPATVQADPEDDAARRAAHAHFTQGLEAAAAGRLYEAALAFERAHTVAPHHSVLYNLGLVYSSLGRRADAVRVLERYLAEGGTKIESSRRTEVERRVQLDAAELSRLRLRIEPRDARIQLDARALQQDELAGAIRVDPGPRVLLVSRPGYLPQTRNLTLLPGETSEVQVSLKPEREPEPTSAALIAAFFACNVPDVELTLDGEKAARPSEGTPFLLSSGGHVVRFSRPGYEPDEQHVTVTGGERVRCQLRPAAELGRQNSAELRLLVPKAAYISVNGTPQFGTRVPAGRHRVTVRHPDYQPWSRTIDLKAGSELSLRPELVPTAEKRQRDAAASERRTWAYASGAAGLGLVATGTVLYFLNGNRYDDWRADNVAFARELSGSSPSTNSRRSLELQSRAANIQLVDDLALGAAALGVAALGAGVGLYISAIPGGRKASDERSAWCTAHGVW